MSRPRNCRHCAFMCCGDANWCDEHDEAMSDAQISVHRNCPDWRWCELDALTFKVFVESCESQELNVDRQLRMEMVA